MTTLEDLVNRVPDISLRKEILRTAKRHGIENQQADHVVTCCFDCPWTIHEIHYWGELECWPYCGHPKGPMKLLRENPGSRYPSKRKVWLADEESSQEKHPSECPLREKSTRIVLDLGIENEAHGK